MHRSQPSLLRPLAAGCALALAVRPAFAASQELPSLGDPEEVMQRVLAGSHDWSAGPDDDRDPDLAHGGGRFLLVWERAFSFDHMDVMGLLLDQKGEAVGVPFPIATSPNNVFQANPSVAWVERAGRFLVAWDRQVIGPFTEQVTCASVSPSGKVSPAVTVAPSPNVQRRPAVGGNHGLSDDAGLVIWDEMGVGLRARRMRALPGPGGPVALGPAFVLAPNVFVLDAVAEPSLSRSADVGQPYLVVWTQPELPAGFGPDHAAIRALAVALDGTPASPGLFVSDLALGHDAGNASCDGDGEDFLVAWEVDEADPASGVRDLRARHVRLCGGALELGPFQAIEDDPGDDEEDVHLAWLGATGSVAAYRDQSGAIRQVRVKSLDPLNGFVANDETLATLLEPTLSCAVAGRRVGASGGEEALLAWHFDDGGPSLGEVSGARWLGPGAVAGQGGGCGAGGVHATPCAIGGNAGFTLHLRGSTPDARAVLVAGGSPLPVGCGPCTLVPALESVFYTLTDAKGDAAVTVPLAPAMSGVSFWSQWATFVDVGACPLAPLDFSDALRTTVE